MNRTQILELITDTIDAYRDLLDEPDDMDSAELAESVVRHLEHAGAIAPTDAGLEA